MLLQGCPSNPFPPPLTNEPEDGVLYIKVYVVHLSVLKEAVVVRHLFKVGW